MIKNPDYVGAWKPRQASSRPPTAPRLLLRSLRPSLGCSAPPHPPASQSYTPLAVQIANPNYFVDEQPHAMAPIGGIGTELWTNLILRRPS